MLVRKIQVGNGSGIAGDFYYSIDTIHTDFLAKAAR